MTRGAKMPNSDVSVHYDIITCTPFSRTECRRERRGVGAGDGSDRKRETVFRKKLTSRRRPRPIVFYIDFIFRTIRERASGAPCDMTKHMYKRRSIVYKYIILCFFFTCA